MEKRKLGGTGLEVSLLTFGCGAVGGLMTKGAPAEQERAFAHAIESGVNIFDTAPTYGDGASERNLGRILKAARADVIVGTKVRLAVADKARIGAAVVAAMDESLTRLGRDGVDLYQLHNRITAAGKEQELSAEVVLGEVVPAFEKLRAAGKTRFFGITSLGDTEALHRVSKAGVLNTGQVAFNLLNPSAAFAAPAGLPGQDYARLLETMRTSGMGSIGIRILAGGALSGTEARHPHGTPQVDPIGSGSSYAIDVQRARRFEPLVKEGHARDLVELAIRYAVSCPLLSTFEVGIATFEQFAGAVAAVKRGPLPAETLARIAAIQAGFAGEAR